PHSQRKKMSNGSSITQFLLLAFADTRELQLLHFWLFLGIYLAALLANGLIITAIACDHHLHTPMYFFLLNLSVLDLGSISTTVPKAMANSLWDTRAISYAGCAAQCDGTESALSDCTNTEWFREYCDHRLDAGVTCSGFVQLVGGDSPCSGRVEIRDGDQWKTVCDSDFSPKAATVVCRELQCGTALSVTGAAHFGEGDGPIWDRELQCVGNESLLASCPRGSPRDEPCSHAKDAGVTCTQFTGFRLMNGSTACEGRVEVQVLGTWGTLCASHWDLLDAHVLCHHLDCGFAESIPRPGHFGRATHPFWRDSFHCDGTEGHLGQCPVTALGALCSHGNDAAVICSGPADSASLRLVGGGSRCDGRVEILQRGTWGRVLDDQWDVQEASVVCRQLRCGEAGTAYNPPKPERGTGPVGLRGVRCAGHEANLALCNTSLPESAPAAGVAEDVGVICWGSRRVRLVNGAGRCAGRVEVYYQGIWGTVCDDGWDLSDATVVCRQLGCGGAVEAAGSAQFGAGFCLLSLCHGRSLPSPDREKIRAVGGEDRCSGRVEVWHRGSWGTVCDDSWDMQDAEVACRQLGCGPAVSALHEAAFGMGTGPIWLEQVECRGTEPSLQDCWARPGDGGACRHKEDAAVNCS
ncbi:PREDICTED: scavenger receptor cysteine-rich type 1 protein M130-like, partial [Haliaeetus leucocephalus]|uniref:scavenger receptor cysteine-rich type 1 protein M130-like n=1 Tax=Haliaeetus leucocephalus TaxID=52644 RepID=UPI00053CDDC6